MSDDRPDAKTTITVLTAGTIVAVASFAVGLGLRYFGQVALADTVSTAAVLVLLATPAVALIATTLELRIDQRSASVAAMLVLVVLGLATVVALILR